MAKSIDVEKQTSHLSSDVLAHRINALVAQLAKDYNLVTTWDAQTNSVGFKADSGPAGGCSGYLQIQQGKILLHVNLSMMLSVQSDFFKSQIEKVMDESLR